MCSKKVNCSLKEPRNFITNFTKEGKTTVVKRKDAIFFQSNTADRIIWSYQKNDSGYNRQLVYLFSDSLNAKF